ncbi:MAG: GDSL-type esterase/lipase family protein [Prolixibacteraceae bacterium]
MKSSIKLTIAIFLFLVVAFTSNGQQKENRHSFLLLSGNPLWQGNPIDADGNIHQFNSPVLHLVLANTKSPKGTILLLPGGSYELLNLKNEGEPIARFLNAEGFDVAILEYHIGLDPNIREMAQADAIKAFQLLKSSRHKPGIRSDRLGIMGISSGGHLAARTVLKLGDMEQPDDLILINPAYLDETVSGTVIPAVMPPVHPTARLFSAFAANGNNKWLKSCEEYTKTWKGYDGLVTFHLLTDTISISDEEAIPMDSRSELAILLKTFLQEKPPMVSAAINPAAIPVNAGFAAKRHADKLALVAKEKFDLIMVGNSITNNFEKPEYEPVWNQFFAPRKALNLGYSGYRTENIIWNIQNGELDGQSPKVIVLEIGTNNVDEKNYPTRHTAGQLAGGIEAIVQLMRKKCPDSKIIVLRCFPGCYGGPNPTSHRFILERASDIISKLADGKHVFYCDVNHVFLNPDGSINHEMMPDWLHPSPAGANAWAQTMEPLLSKLMRDKSL